uniref:hypothetical protein n=1 Tax=Nonomuraea pusilla TaxID=46177 RepID=UPI000A798F77|nr:hypothetical protein [Nonomuraea pusilla]
MPSGKIGNTLARAVLAVGTAACATACVTPGTPAWASAGVTTGVPAGVIWLAAGTAAAGTCGTGTSACRATADLHQRANGRHPSRLTAGDEIGAAAGEAARRLGLTGLDSAPGAAGLADLGGVAATWRMGPLLPSARRTEPSGAPVPLLPALPARPGSHPATRLSLGSMPGPYGELTAEGARLASLPLGPDSVPALTADAEVSTATDATTAETRAASVTVAAGAPEQARVMVEGLAAGVPLQDGAAGTAEAHIALEGPAAGTAGARAAVAAPDARSLTGSRPAHERLDAALRFLGLR